MRLRLLTALVLASSLAPPALWAQCPDGSVPPCRSTAVRPTLDERAWLVLPFHNLSGAPDIDWLSSASVNLLYLGLAQWRDQRPIDDERVSDLLRRSGITATSPIVLDRALVLARSVGAGRLVMGDIVRAGPTTQIVAKVYTTSDGRRVQTVQRLLPHPDSVLVEFARIARELAGGRGAAEARDAVGTPSLAAYRAYLDGVRAMSDWRLDSAASRFREAAGHDSNFALAFYRLALVESWRADNSDALREVAARAERLSEALRPRERALITALAARSRLDFATACPALARLVVADSTDADAWFEVGDCALHDMRLVRLENDTTRFRFLSNWESALGAFTRALEADPAFYPAFRQIAYMLRADFRQGCLVRVNRDCRPEYVAVVRVASDTIATEPLSAMQRGQYTPPAVTPDYASDLALRRRSREIAARWAVMAPTQTHAHLALARASLDIGDTIGAFAAACLVRPENLMFSRETGEALTTLVESAVLAGRLDSALAWLGRERGRGSPADPLSLAAMYAALGRLEDAAAIVAPLQKEVQYFVSFWRAAAGLRSDSLAQHSQTYRATFLADAPRNLRSALDEALGASAQYVSPGVRLPITGTARDGGDPLLRFSASLMTGDTSAARLAIRAYDSMFVRTPRELGFAGSFALSAFAHLAMHDSATAFNHLTEFVARARYTRMFEPLGGEDGASVSHVYGRAGALLVDLALARRRPDAAQIGNLVLSRFWGAAGPSLEPVVARARQRSGQQ